MPTLRKITITVEQGQENEPGYTAEIFRTANVVTEIKPEQPDDIFSSEGLVRSSTKQHMVMEFDMYRNDAGEFYQISKLS